MERSTITPDDLPDWIEVHSTVRSPDEGWRGVCVRGWTTQMLDAEVPPFHDHLLVAWLNRGPVTMHRQTGNRWQQAPVGPGVITLQPRGQESRWVWEGELDVLHVYVSPQELEATAAQMYDRDVAGIELSARIDVEDPFLDGVMARLRHEALRAEPGARLAVESLATELGVTLLRRHARLRFAEQPGPGTLTRAQLRLLQDYVRDRLSGSLSLDELAGVLSLSRFHFSRVFRRTTGMTPHAYVQGERLDRARNLLRRTNVPLSAIAADCGFADASHFSRVFRQQVGTTPARFRAASWS